VPLFEKEEKGKFHSAIYERLFYLQRAFAATFFP
jgi:hypothetical protein